MTLWKESMLRMALTCVLLKTTTTNDLLMVSRQHCWKQKNSSQEVGVACTLWELELKELVALCGNWNRRSCLYSIGNRIEVGVACTLWKCNKRSCLYFMGIAIEGVACNLWELE